MIAPRIVADLAGFMWTDRNVSGTHASSPLKFLYESDRLDCCEQETSGVVPTYYNEIVEIMKGHGCWQVPGGKGSHEKWCSPINGRTVTVPRSKSRHSANEVLKQLGIGKKL